MMIKGILNWVQSVQKHMDISDEKVIIYLWYSFTTHISVDFYEIYIFNEIMKYSYVTRLIIFMFTH